MRSSDDFIHLRLYVAGDTPRSAQALRSVRRLQDTPLAGRYALEIVDVLEQPQRAEEDHILATPTLVRLAPGPPRRIMGDLADLEQLVQALSATFPEGSSA